MNAEQTQEVIQHVLSTSNIITSIRAGRRSGKTTLAECISQKLTKDRKVYVLTHYPDNFNGNASNFHNQGYLVKSKVYDDDIARKADVIIYDDIPCTVKPLKKTIVIYTNKENKPFEVKPDFSFPTILGCHFLCGELRIEKNAENIKQICDHLKYVNFDINRFREEYNIPDLNDPDWLG